MDKGKVIMGLVIALVFVTVIALVSVNMLTNTIDDLTLELENYVNEYENLQED